ncbi:MAG: RNA polymerase sigma factor [Bradymonadales bacterium]|nr:RNA polymerase sigma factor [Bradymonadales bacterium]
MIQAVVLALIGRNRANEKQAPEAEGDEDLMLQYASGDLAAFEELLRRHERPVYNFIARYLGDRAAAEDLVQEVFLRVIRTRKRYKKKAKFRTWLFTITRNVCIDRMRSLGRRSEVSLNRCVSSDGDESGATFLDQLTDEEPSGGSGSMIRAEFRNRLQRALEELPAEQREVFIMKEFSGMKFREIADAVGSNENTVKSRMRYALETLRGHLEEYRQYSFDQEEEKEHTA